MKHFNKILIAVMMVMGILTHKTVTTHGQSLGANAIDTRTSAVKWLDQHFSQPSL
jgi:hypothetical protein